MALCEASRDDVLSGIATFLAPILSSPPSPSLFVALHLEPLAAPIISRPPLSLPIASYLEPLAALAVPVGHKAGGAHDDDPLCNGAAPNQLVAALQQRPQQRDTLQRLAQALHKTWPARQGDRAGPARVWADNNAGRDVGRGSAGRLCSSRSLVLKLALKAHHASLCLGKDAAAAGWYGMRPTTPTMGNLGSEIGA